MSKYYDEPVEDLISTAKPIDVEKEKVRQMVETNILLDQLIQAVEELSEDRS